MTDFAAAGLLDGVDGEARAARERLLSALHDDGATLDELKAAVADDTLFLLPAERLMGGRTRYTAPQIAAEGRDRPRLPQGSAPRPGPAGPRRRGGRCSPRATSTRARTAQTFVEAGLDTEDMLEVVRILGRGFSQAAEVMRVMTLGLVLEPGADEHDLAQRFADAVSTLEPLTAPMLGQMLNLHLRHVVRSEALTAAQRRDGELPGAREMAVCFADLVGFTRIGEEVAPDELGALAARLEGLTADVVALPVRLVKTIGDAVMLVAPDARSLLGAALELVARADAEGETFPQLRVGIAAGPALQRAGDFYGHPVNLASRVTGVARPGSVLITEAIRDAVREDEGFRLSFAGERPLKGVRGAVKLWRARRADV